ncbi:hypothetical protein TWF718_009682 [Orbilia javanica]|uniref:Chromo domain-containing protein n=1 Tax=Orbilia javanica TaxID=47235 RepID=A0AAN8RFV6_9PEZI
MPPLNPMLIASLLNAESKGSGLSRDQVPNNPQNTYSQSNTNDNDCEPSSAYQNPESKDFGAILYGNSQTGRGQDYLIHNEIYKTLDDTVDKMEYRIRSSSGDFITPQSISAELNNHEREYEVECVMGKRKRTGKKTEYLVKWTGYAKCTWEPAGNLRNARGAVDEYYFQRKKQKSRSNSTRK